MSHHADREILKHICKLSSAYKPFQLTILVVIKTVPVAIGGTFAALAGAGASIHRGGGMLADFRMEMNKQIADLRIDLNNLLLSHGELRNNVHTSGKRDVEEDPESARGLRDSPGSPTGDT